MDLVLASLPLPIRLRAETPLSDGELMQFSRENRPLRMEREGNGDILVMTPTGNRTGNMNQRIGRLLDEWAEVDGRGLTFDSDTGFKLPSGAVRSPDAAWMSNERWNSLSDEEQERFGMCPDFVVELASPSDRAADLKKKIEEEWLPGGVELAWLIDPKARTVTVYRAGEGAEVLVEPSSVEGSGCVRGFSLVMARVWGG